MCISHDWRSANSSENAVSKLSIMFLAAVTSGAGCITEIENYNQIKYVTNNKMLHIHFGLHWVTYYIER